MNAAQVAAASVSGLQSGSQLTIQGEVTHAESAARLTVLGGAGATATAGGTYALSGNHGSITLDITVGESLADVAERINEHTAATGVAAAVVANDLVLTGTEIGRESSVHLEPLDVEVISAEGVNAQQVAQFEIASLTPGATETLAGSFSTAQAAELLYRGEAGGVAAGTASFQLTGTRGAATITLTRGESLAVVAARINDQSAATGVVASVAGDDLRLTSDTVGAAATVRVDSIQPAYDQTVSGVNTAQVGSFTVISVADGSEHVLSGQVTRTATAAELALQGGAGATAIDSATFELTGSLGTATIAITDGESLSAVATRVNNLSGTTGIAAQVSGNQLLLQSTDLGSAASVEVELIHVQHTTNVSGVNSQQLTSFQVNQITDGASQVLSGSVTQTAGLAELTFRGTVLQTVGTNATFTLSGSLGSVQLSTTSLQSLSNLAAQVNSHTVTTGVTATVQGRNVRFRSVGVGGTATVGIQVNSGTFNVTGGNGNGTANGTNGVAVVNGQTITGAGNDFQVTTATGNYSFTAASGFTGAFSSVSITSTAGSFAISGGNGDGTAAGSTRWPRSTAWH